MLFVKKKDEIAIMKMAGKKKKKNFEKVLNSNTFVISCSVSLTWLVCGILPGPPHHITSNLK
ncbi:MAG: hypothetical protein Q8772_00535, partial [Candidatus Phytoplasma australasiaticum]|nr:hypothetical protein [Candidatus Phytoplasma australasiaticum]